MAWLSRGNEAAAKPFLSDLWLNGAVCHFRCAGEAIKDASEVPEVDSLTKRE